MDSVSYLVDNNKPSFKINVFTEEYVNNNPNDFVKNDDEIIDEDEMHLFQGSANNPEFTTHHSLTKANEKNIREDLEKFNLPLDVINAADNIFQKLYISTRRGGKRKQLVYHCVRAAFDYLGIAKDPKELATICEIDPSDVSRAASMCSPVQTNSSSSIVEYSPSQFIPGVFERLEEAIESQVQFPEGTLDQILDIAAEVTPPNDDDDPNQIYNPLLDDKPQLVAAAIIVYYLEMHGIFLDRKKYKPIFHSTYSTINKLKIQVEEAYNKEI
jgi:hypothetical protein